MLKGEGTRSGRNLCRVLPQLEQARSAQRDGSGEGIGAKSGLIIRMPVNELSPALVEVDQAGIEAMLQGTFQMLAQSLNWFWPDLVGGKRVGRSEAQHRTRFGSAPGEESEGIREEIGFDEGQEWIGNRKGQPALPESDGATGIRDDGRRKSEWRRLGIPGWRGGDEVREGLGGGDRLCLLRRGRARLLSSRGRRRRWSGCIRWRERRSEPEGVRSLLAQLAGVRHSSKRLASQNTKQTGRDIGLQESSGSLGEAGRKVLNLHPNARGQSRADARLDGLVERGRSEGGSEGIQSSSFSPMDAAIGLIPAGVGQAIDGKVMDAAEDAVKKGASCKQFGSRNLGQGSPVSRGDGWRREGEAAGRWSTMKAVARMLDRLTVKRMLDGGRRMSSRSAVKAGGQVRREAEQKVKRSQSARLD
jgi:hypothetical protein